MIAFSESIVEEAALAWLRSAGWQVRNGAEIAPGEPAAERDDYGRVVLAQCLRDALARLNPALSAEALDDAFRKLTRPERSDIIVRNRALHRLLVDGVTVECRDAGGSIRGAQARAIDFDDPAGSDWLAVNQFSVVENKHSRRPDVVLCVNGLPLAVLELKNAAAQNRLGAPVLFSHKKVSDLIDPALKTKKKPLERYHLFPRAWQEAQGKTDLKVINQMTDFALLEWPENIGISDDPPSVFVPKIRSRFKPDEWQRMHELHALPDQWESLGYSDFLAVRRRLMAGIIRRGFESL